MLFARGEWDSQVLENAIGGFRDVTVIVSDPKQLVPGPYRS